MVAVEPVLETIADQVEPPSVERSILYPVIAEPPLFVGADQERLICDEETVLATRLVGAAGMVLAVCVVADAVLDGELVPIGFIVDTLYV